MEIFNIKDEKDRHIYQVEQIEKIDNLMIKFKEAIFNGDKEWEDSALLLDKIWDYIENIKQVIPNWKEIKLIKLQREEIQDYKNKIEELENKLKGER